MFEASGLVKKMMLVICTSCMYTYLTKGGQQRLHPPQSEFWLHCSRFRDLLRCFHHHHCITFSWFSVYLHISIAPFKWTKMSHQSDLLLLDIFPCLYHDSYLLSCLSKFQFSHVSSGNKYYLSNTRTVPYSTWSNFIPIQRLFFVCVRP